MAGAVVQLKEAQGGGATATTIASGTLASNVTAGNYLYILVSCDNTPTITVTKNSGTATIGTITSHGSASEAALVNKTEHFTCQVTGTGTIDILATLGSSETQRVIAVTEVSGVNAIDGAPDITANNNSPTDLHSITIATQPAFGLMYCANFQGAGTGQGTNWTIHTTIDWSATIGEGILQTRAITTTGAITGNFTNGGFDRCATTMIIFTDGGAVVDPVRGRRIYVMP